MSVSVLTLVKDRTAHLENLVEGLRRSRTVPGELVVVDMSSTPIETPSASFPIQMIRLNVSGLPLARARNLAAKAANRERLIFLDVDCIPSTDLLAVLPAVMDDHDGLVCADVRYLPAGATAQAWTERSLVEAGEPHPVREFPKVGIRREGNAGLFWSLAFGVRRNSFLALGGFDEAFCGYGAEDTDFGFRARDAGLPLLFVGGAVAFHQHHDVYDPPLQHFDDILANAQRFHKRWGFWPMSGWLNAFANLGLIVVGDTEIRVIRSPDIAEIAAAQRPATQAF